MADGSEFQIILVHSTCQYRTVNIIRDMRCVFSIDNPYALMLQSLGNGRGSPVRAGYGKASMMQNLRQTTHADTADADKINRKGVLKIYLIHDSA